MRIFLDFTPHSINTLERMKLKQPNREKNILHGKKKWNETGFGVSRHEDSVHSLATYTSV